MVVALALFMATTGVFLAAQEQPSNQQLLRELEALKARIQQLESQQQGTAANALSATVQSVEAKKEADAALKVTSEATPILEKLRKGQIQVGRTNIFLNGWIEASANYREHSQLSGPSSSNPSTIPFPNQAQYYATEFRTGPPQTRFGLNSVSDLTNNYILRSKLEFDLLSGSNAANTGNINGSWTPRLRAGWMEVDNLKGKWHVMAGQGYSLTVPSGNGIQADGNPSPNLAWTLLPNTEAPPVPDDSPMAGAITSTRNMQLRLIKEIARNTAVAISFENNVVNWGGDKGSLLEGTPGVPFTGTALPKPIVSASSFSTGTVAYTSLGTMPDIIGKIGYDTPGHRAHLEAWGIFRQYKDDPGSIAVSLPQAGKAYAGGGNIGGYIKLIPNKLDFQFAGGYGSFGAQLNGFIPDVTYNSAGAPVPIYEKELGAQLIPHVTKNIDMYFEVGIERANSAGINTGATTGNSYGYGNPFNAGTAGTAGCLTKFTTSLTATCAADNQTVADFLYTLVWRTINNPKLGHLDLLPQVLYSRRNTFRDQFGASAHTSDYAIDIVARYWPW